MLEDGVGRRLIRSRPPFRGTQVRRSQQPLDTELQERLRVDDCLLQQLRLFAGDVAGVLAGGQRDDVQVDLERLLPCVELLRGVLTGVVRVIRENYSARIVLEHTEVLVGQGRAARRHGPPEAGAMEADHVGIALAHDDLAGFDNARLRPVEPVQRSALRVDLRLGRVLVLRSIGIGELAAAERDRRARRIEDREQDAALEEVVELADLADVAEPRVAGHVGWNAEGLAHHIPAVRRPSHLEAADGVSVVPPRPKVRAGPAGIGRREQPLVVPLGRCGDGVEELRPPDPVTAGGLVVVAELDVGLRREALDRGGEVEAFEVAHERDDIALGPAAVAEVHALLRVDGERR